MERISSRYVSDYDAEKRDNTGRVYCPFCGEVYTERDMEEYREEGTERSLDICSRCRKGFEQDSERDFESDTLSKDVFSRMWNEAPPQRKEVEGLNEGTAAQVATALGGEPWQSGGGIWLVLLRRRDGALVVLSDEAVCEYASEGDFDRNVSRQAVRFV